MSASKPVCAVCHIEVPAPDLAKAMRFYGEVFGWEIGEQLGPNYCIWHAGDLGGGFSADMAPCDDGMNVVLGVEDIPAKLEEIAKAGGAVVKGKTEIGGGYGFYALFKDPNGNRLGLWSKT